MVIWFLSWMSFGPKFEPFVERLSDVDYWRFVEADNFSLKKFLNLVHYFEYKLVLERLLAKNEFLMKKEYVENHWQILTVSVSTDWSDSYFVLKTLSSYDRIVKLSWTFIFSFIKSIG
jgi:hypothetical protein